MYDKILNAELIIPDRFASIEAQDILARLLERDPKRRLGTKSSDEIKNHPFFADINWDDLYNKRITPPWVPNVKDDADTRYFDEEFTTMDPVDSVSKENGILTAKDKKYFKGFTYTHSGELNVRDGVQYSSHRSDSDFLES
jgi:serine/threonine protein kinase